MSRSFLSPHFTALHHRGLGNLKAGKKWALPTPDASIFQFSSNQQNSATYFIIKPELSLPPPPPPSCMGYLPFFSLFFSLFFLLSLLIHSEGLVSYNLSYPIASASVVCNNARLTRWSRPTYLP